MQSIWIRRLLRFLVDSTFILAFGAVLSAALFRLAPGADTDVREMNSQLSNESLKAIREERIRSHSFFARSGSYFLGALRGDLGESESSGLPVSDLLRDRVPATVGIVLTGASVGFLTGVLIASLSILLLPQKFSPLFSSLFLILLSLPAGLLVLFAIFARIPVDLAVAAVVSPRTFFYAARMFRQQRSAPWVLGALASGITPARIVIHQILPALRSELAALFGLSIVTAIAAAIPAEVLSGTPGIGQLAWKSAMDRDLPVVIAVTMAMIVAARAITLVSSIPARDLRPTA